MSAKRMFQSGLVPDNSGRLPQKEGIVAFSQNIIGLAGQLVVGKGIFTPEEYFFLLMQNLFTHPGGGNVFLRAYPPGTNPNVFGSYLAAGNDPGLDFSFVGSGGNPFVPIPAGWILVPMFFNIAGEGSQTIYGVQYKDACDLNRNVW